MFVSANMDNIPQTPVASRHPVMENLTRTPVASSYPVERGRQSFLPSLTNSPRLSDIYQFGNTLRK